MHLFYHLFIYHWIYSIIIISLTLIWVGFLGVCFEVVGAGGKITAPCLKIVCIMLETLHVSTDPYVVSENIPFSTKVLLILLMSSFCCEKLAFLAKIILLLKAIV